MRCWGATTVDALWPCVCPPLLAGVAGSSVAQTRYVLDALDRLNALTRWGLVAAPLLVESAPAFAIESTGQSLYARMNREELLAYTPTSDGLVFASNLAVLERLLRERHRRRRATNGISLAGRTEPPAGGHRPRVAVV